MRMTVLGHGQFFQLVLLACTYNIDTLITLQKKSTLQIFHQTLYTKRYTVQANIINMPLKLSMLNITT